MFERAMTGLHVALTAALAAMAVASVLLGADFELLAARQGNGAWWFIGIWLVLSALIAVLPGSIVQWRAGLCVSAAALLVAALAGLWRGAPHAMAMGIALLTLAAILVFSAWQLRARPHKPAHLARSDARPADWKRRLCWWIVVLCMAEAFRMAQLGAGNAVKGAGSFGMLLVFFVLLPALSVSTWFPRLAGIGWLLATVPMTWLLWRTPSVSVAIGMALVAAGGVMLLRAPVQDIDKSEMPQ
ncbi:hypothetical protein GCM10007205_21250 [Oxalicibacterium flavum]|uniref:Uncharacterized protein n=1 Tax=Oxalicibacterium flavum TaxID=179467 RepID=A0A8J2UNB8_9BURK|nr:hypothetical protein [Oxalicibacterium flavum]GGC11883.1 hypothetical protein GCM10007205_21250 [Oxalicibacterium flavum]